MNIVYDPHIAFLKATSVLRLERADLRCLTIRPPSFIAQQLAARGRSVLRQCCVFTSVFIKLVFDLAAFGDFYDNIDYLWHVVAGRKVVPRVRGGAARHSQITV